MIETDLKRFDFELDLLQNLIIHDSYEPDVL